jgi:hypothetical protein
MARKAKAEPKTAADPTSHGMSEEDFDPEEVEAHRRATAEREEVWTTRDAERMAVRANMVGEARTIGCRVETATLFCETDDFWMMLNKTDLRGRPQGGWLRDASSIDDWLRILRHPITPAGAGHR